MCGSLLSKFKSGNRVAPAPGKDSLETKEFPGKAKLSDEPTAVEIPNPVEKNLDQHEDTGINLSERTKTCAEDCESESNDEEKAVERTAKSAVVAVTTEFPAARPRELPPLHRPTVDIKKVKQVVAKDMARLKKRQAEKELAKEKLVREKLENEILVKEKLTGEKLETENLAQEKFSKEQLVKEKLPKERLVIEKWAKQQVVIREKLEAIEGGQASSSNTVATKPISSARAHSILLGKTKRAIAFEVLVGRKRRETVLLSARVPRCLRRLHSPPLLTAEVLVAKQLAAREKRLKELERVRDCARACAQTASGPHPLNDICMSSEAEKSLPSKEKSDRRPFTVGTVNNR